MGQTYMVAFMDHTGLSGNVHLCEMGAQPPASAVSEAGGDPSLAAAMVMGVLPTTEAILAGTVSQNILSYFLAVGDKVSQFGYTAINSDCTSVAM
jgi:hypothetical protein